MMKDRERIVKVKRVKIYIPSIDATTLGNKICMREIFCRINGNTLDIRYPNKICQRNIPFVTNFPYLPSSIEINLRLSLGKTFGSWVKYF